MLHQKNYAAGQGMRIHSKGKRNDISSISHTPSHPHLQGTKNLWSSNLPNYHVYDDSRNFSKSNLEKLSVLRKPPLVPKATRFANQETASFKSSMYPGSKNVIDREKPQEINGSASNIVAVKKYEMCSNDRCHYGSKCKFAHSQDELVHDYPTLLAEGRVDDLETDRNLPCFDALSTGMCPFLKDRCNRVHDPKWMNHEDSCYVAWLRHREMPCPDYPVNNTYHLIQDQMYEGGRILRQQEKFKNIEKDSKSGVLSVLKIQNSDGMAVEVPITDVLGNDRTLPFSEIETLTVAIRMHDTETYTYQPNHVLGGQPCMVLKIMDFNCARDTESHIVHKIAFGPAGKTSGNKLPPVAIWFNLAPYELIANPEKAKEQHKEHHKTSGGEHLTENARSILQSRLGIVAHYNYDRDVSCLLLDRMRLRLENLNRDNLKNSNNFLDHTHLRAQVIDLQYKVIESRLNRSIKSHFEICCPSISEDRSLEKALRPSCDRSFSCRGKTGRGHFHLTHFNKSFEDTLQLKGSKFIDRACGFDLYERATNNGLNLNVSSEKISMPLFDVNTNKTPVSFEQKWDAWRLSICHTQYEQVYHRVELIKNMRASRV